jgi:hypothetical protein
MRISLVKIFHAGTGCPLWRVFIQIVEKGSKYFFIMGCLFWILRKSNYCFIEDVGNIVFTKRKHRLAISFINPKIHQIVIYFIAKDIN